MTVANHVLLHSGKVRDLYAPLNEAGEVDSSRLLLVATDRISAYDWALEPAIPDKGAILTQLSLWWCDQLADIAPHHVLPDAVPAEVAGRAVYVRRLRMLPAECIARAHLTGGGLQEYARTGAVCGVPLPAGLLDGDQLDEPIFTPSTKAAQGEHDQPMTYPEVEELLGRRLAAYVREATVAILGRGHEIAAQRGIIIADTKVEFGVDPQDLEIDPAAPVDEAAVDWTAVDPERIQIVLADEVLTPDSSRFWRASQWQPGNVQTSYDKQVVRDWLTSPASGWDRDSGQAPPALPSDVVALTRERYVEAYESLTGERFPSPSC